MDRNPRPKTHEETVSSFAYPENKKVFLKKPDVLVSKSFFEVATERASQRKFSALPESRLAELLWYSAKVISTHPQANGYILSHRPSPSAGARHPIDIIVSMPSKERKLEYYNPFDHSLNVITADQILVDNFVDHINECLEIQQGTIIWFLAHQARTTAKYDHPESLVWRDAGALIYCMQIASAALDLSSCAIGTLADPYIEKLFGEEMISAGGIIIGENFVL
ncbi:nitroreductase family protein [Pedobacter steynii]